ncbi:MAG: hypothetical protein QM499_00990 [Flavobacteriaceae bacterium]
MKVYDFLIIMIFGSSIVLLAVSFLYLLRKRKEIEIYEFWGLVTPTTFLLGSLLVNLDRIEHIPYKLLLTTFVMSYSYLNFKLTRKLTRDIYSQAIKINAMFYQPHKHVEKLFSQKKEINYSDLESIEINVPIMLAKGIVIMRLNYPFEGLQFKTWIKEGCEFEPHLHTDCCEFISVIKGELKCKIQGVSVPEAEILILPSNILHHPHTEIYTELLVYFKKE